MHSQETPVLEGKYDSYLLPARLIIARYKLALRFHANNGHDSGINSQDDAESGIHV